MQNSSTNGVLVASDSATTRQMVAHVLRHMGLLRISEAVNLQTALTTLKEQRVAYAIGDWDMAGSQGRHLVQVMKSSEAFHAIPILVLAEGTPDNVNAAVAAGVAGIVLKPFSPAALQAKIEKAFPRLAVAKASGPFERL